MSQATATVRSTGAEAGHTSLAVFGTTRPGFEFTDLEPPPDVPHPDDCPSFRDPPPEDFVFDWEPMPFWEQRMGYERQSVIFRKPLTD